MGTIKSLFFGGVLRTVLTLAVVLALVVAGAFSMGALGVPSVTGVSNSFGTVNQSTTEIHTALGVHNPNPVGASLGGLTVNYTVRMNDVQMANGTRHGLSLGPGNSTIEFTTLMGNGRIPDWWVSHVRNGESTTVRIDVQAHSGLLGRTFQAPPITRHISTDIISNFNSTEDRPVNANQPPISDPVLVVKRTSANWGQVTAERTPIRLRFTVHNPKSSPIPISELDYNITMNNITMGQGQTNRTYVIPAHSTKTIEATTYLHNQRLDDWWVSHLENGQVTHLRIDFAARLDTGVAGTVQVPLDQLTYRKTIRTDIFGTKDATGNTGGTDAVGPTTTTTDDAGATTSSDAGTTTSSTTTTTTTTTTTSGGGLLNDTAPLGGWAVPGAA